MSKCATARRLRRKWSKQLSATFNICNLFEPIVWYDEIGIEKGSTYGVNNLLPKFSSKEMKHPINYPQVE
jgi:hypothetical protein